MKKIFIKLMGISLFLVFTSCMENEKVEPSILLGSNYKAVIAKLGEPANKGKNNEDNFLVYERNLDFKGYDYEIYFSKKEGYYYNENGEDDNERIDMIGGNFFIFPPEIDEILTFVGDRFLGGNINFEFIAVKEINKIGKDEFKTIAYTAENTNNLENIGKIYLTFFIKNDEVTNFELTSCNNDDFNKNLFKK